MRRDNLDYDKKLKSQPSEPSNNKKKKKLKKNLFKKIHVLIVFVLVTN